MSQLERLEEERKSKKVRKNGRAGAPAPVNFVAFHPTKEEKQAIKADETPLQDVISFLLSFVEDGHKLTFGHKPENDAYYVMLREGNVAWDKAVTLSVWHQDPWISVYGLKNALEGRYAGFPNVQLGPFSDVDW